jgi:hypothetical protein
VLPIKESHLSFWAFLLSLLLLETRSNQQFIWWCVVTWASHLGSGLVVLIPKHSFTIWFALSSAFSTKMQHSSEFTASLVKL